MLYPFAQKWFETKSGTVWVISDLHFGDKELKKGIPNRPSDAQIISNLNKHVGKFGTLLVLGDCGEPESVKLLRGHKILIAGNHDNVGEYRNIFDEVYEGPVMINEKILLSHEPIDVPWAFNLHGHDHVNQTNKFHSNQYNVNIDVHGINPLNLNKFLKNGGASKVKTLHRSIIDHATQRKRGR